MITAHDHQKITDLLRNIGKTGLLNELETKLEALKLIESVKAPPNLITMNSMLVLRDLQNNEKIELRLVYQLSPLYKNQVSVMAPLGTALLGSRENTEVQFQGRDSLKKKYFVEKITYQPESEGKLD